MVASVMNHGTIILLAVEILVMHQSGNLITGQKRLPHPVSSSQSNKGLLFWGYKLANQTVFAQTSSDLQNFFVAYQMDPQIWPWLVSNGPWTLEHGPMEPQNRAR
jgi:hypothetical protein